MSRSPAAFGRADLVPGTSDTLPFFPEEKLVTAGATKRTRRADRYYPAIRTWSQKLSFRKSQALLRRVACDSASEQQFWKAVDSMDQDPRPNWGVDLNPGRPPLSADLFVYLFDTSSMWVASAAIQPAQLVSIRCDEGSGGESDHRSRAAAAIAKASSRGRVGAQALSSPETLEALAAGLRAIATSSSFGTAAGRSLMLDNCHWILLMYRLADGELVTGVGHVEDPYPGMLDRGTLEEYVESMVAMDVTPDDSIVGVAARKHGGVVLAPELSHVCLS